jgi:hypothetical protein
MRPDPIEICRWLNREGVSAAPCPWLPAISIHDDEEYEGHDFDLIRPRERLRIGRVLTGHGLRRRGAREFEHVDGTLELPRPGRSLASDPAEELLRLLERPSTLPFATPTQAVLVTLRLAGSELPAARAADLEALVREHPVNLEKIDRRLQRAPIHRAWMEARPGIESVQRDGILQRRRREFRSSLPR